MDRYRDDVEEIPAEACWELLGPAGIGRLAVVVDGEPEIFPVNYAVDDGTLVFRSGEGTKVAGAVPQAPVALEVDGHDPSTSRAWSVVVKGRAEEVRRGHALMRALELPLFPAQGGVKDRFVRIAPTAVTGRRFTVADPAAWNSSSAAGRRTPSGSVPWTRADPGRP